MARQPRIVIPDTPHHICQRGNRGETVFFEKADYDAYLTFLSEECIERGVTVWAWCLLHNEIQMIVVPSRETALARAFGEAHRRYTRRINERNGFRGHLFQDRFFSYPMDDTHLPLAARHIERLPVATGIAQTPEQYLWSSARAHVKQREDKLIPPKKPLLQLFPNWAEYLQSGFSAPDFVTLIDRHLQTGRPRGSETFLSGIELRLGRTVRPQKPGRRSITFTKNLRRSHAVGN